MILLSQVIKQNPLILCIHEQFPDYHLLRQYVLFHPDHDGHRNWPLSGHRQTHAVQADQEEEVHRPHQLPPHVGHSPDHTAPADDHRPDLLHRWTQYNHMLWHAKERHAPIPVRLGSLSHCHGVHPLLLPFLCHNSVLYQCDTQAGQRLQDSPERKSNTAGRHCSPGLHSLLCSQQLPSVDSHYSETLL